jgi:hypothetical protein
MAGSVEMMPLSGTVSGSLHLENINKPSKRVFTNILHPTIRRPMAMDHTQRNTNFEKI